jgi:hypothetical protein
MYELVSTSVFTLSRKTLNCVTSNKRVDYRKTESPPGASKKKYLGKDGKELTFQVSDSRVQ